MSIRHPQGALTPGERWRHGIAAGFLVAALLAGGTPRGEDLGEAPEVAADAVPAAPPTPADEAAASDGDASILVPELSIESMEPAPEAAETASPRDAADAAPQETNDAIGTPAGGAPASEMAPLEILGGTVRAGELRRLRWAAGQSFSGRSLDTPVWVVRGRHPGPTLCLTAAIHGDELNGIEIVRRVIRDLDPGELHGTVIAVPIVNLLGFTSGTRYLPDRRDLNRYFPGNPSGSSASRIAHLFFSKVVKHCDRLVDFHTGSFKRTNVPQLRADLQNPEVLDFVGHFGATAVLHKPGGIGTLRFAATNSGIPAVTFELGEPGTLQIRHVEFGVKSVETLLGKLRMVKIFRLWSEPQPLYYGSHWVRADRGGILTNVVKLGANVKRGDTLGTITNPLSNETFEINSPHDGRVLGMALNQFVLPGFAAFHIGIESEVSEAIVNAQEDLNAEEDGAGDNASDADSEESPAADYGAGDSDEYH